LKIFNIYTPVFAKLADRRRMLLEFAMTDEEGAAGHEGQW